MAVPMFMCGWLADFHIYVPAYKMNLVSAPWTSWQQWQKSPLISISGSITQNALGTGWVTWQYIFQSSCWFSSQFPHPQAWQPSLLPVWHGLSTFHFQLLKSKLLLKYCLSYPESIPALLQSQP